MAQSTDASSHRGGTPRYTSPLEDYLDRFNTKSPRVSQIESVPDPDSPMTDDPIELDKVPETPRKRIAIIGGGISGLAAYWALQKTHHVVELFEMTNDLGTLTRPIAAGTQPNDVHINKSFINFFPGTSSHLQEFFGRLKIPYISTPFSFSVAKRENGKQFDMGFSFLKVATSRVRDWLTLDTWKLYFDIWRFHYFSLDLLRGREAVQNDIQIVVESGCPTRRTIGQYLDEKRYSRIFIKNYLVPMAQIVWNVQSEKDLRDLSVKQFVGFLWSFGIMALSPEVYIVEPRARTEAKVRKRIVLRSKTKAIHLRSKVTTVEVVLRNGCPKLRVSTLGEPVPVLYDYVIFAVSAEEALRLLSSGATQKEQAILSAFETTKIEAWLHSDSRFISTGNTSAYINWADSSAFPPGNFNAFSVSYRLNSFDAYNCRESALYITLNPIVHPNPAKIVARWEYRRPLLNAKALNAREKLHEIQNVEDRHLLFCGSWTGYGLHEDGVRSAFQLVTRYLDAKLPFTVNDSAIDYKPPRQLNFWDYSIRSILWMIDWLIVACSLIAIRTHDAVIRRLPIRYVEQSREY
ncbi:amine oxidase [Coccidioides immitis RMSCC 3703]|uniref:Amine oxidase n=2 Tax=Coccidioides immitis TaxID=5501 RepID=A0A0J8QZ11_COCIT|nr:hypothetical protein CIRG_01574 [Coccidioides immitis RMSCC 2394]KMU77300.1 amine oxidase [Coccidioides immitis RMSCC 3703]